MAAHFGGSRAAGRGLRQGRRRTGRGRQQPARFGLDRAPAAAARPGRHPWRAIFRRGRGREAQAHPARDRTSSASTRWCCRIRHAVAWTFNIRGADVSHTPLPLSYALVPKDGRPTVFIDHRKLSNSARDHLEQIRRRRGAGRADAEAHRAGAARRSRSRSTAPPPPTR